MFNDKIDPNNIIKKTLVNSIKIKGNESLNIVIEEAQFAKVNGKEVLLDEICIQEMNQNIFDAVNKCTTKYNPLPKRITLSYKENEVIQQPSKVADLNSIDNDYIKSYKPSWKIEDVHIDESSKKQILSALTISKYKDKLFEEWGLKSTSKNGRSVVINFYGPPGTGKSIMAEAIADYLNQDVYLINYSELESKYVGETPKNIAKAFKRAQENNSVLIFDEADSFLGKRLTNVSQSADYGVNITRSVMLLEIEKFDGVVIFTTNLISNYDEAFKRRILANVEFKLPDKRGRTKIWEVHLPDKLPLENGITPEFLAGRYDNISGADIKDIILYAAVLALQKHSQAICDDDFDEAYKYIKNRYDTPGFTVKHKIISNEQYEKEIASEGVE